MAKKKKGWYIYLVECANGSFSCGIARNLNKEIKEINDDGKYRYFRRYREKLLPVKVIYSESNLPFREAFAKRCFLSAMNRQQRLVLLKKKKFNNSWILYMYGTRSHSGMYGFS